MAGGFLHLTHADHFRSCLPERISQTRLPCARCGMMRALRSAPESAPKTRNSGMWRHLSPDRNRLLQTLQALPCLRPCIPPKKSAPDRMPISDRTTALSRVPSPRQHDGEVFSPGRSITPRPAPGGLRALSRQFFPQAFRIRKNFPSPGKKRKHSRKRGQKTPHHGTWKIKNIFINRL